MTNRPPFLDWPGWKHWRFAAVLALAVAAWSFWVYAGAHTLNAHRALRVRLHWGAERDVPFVPAALLCYYSGYLLFFAIPFAIRERENLFTLFMTFNVLVLIAGLGFLAFPGELGFSVHQNAGRMEWLFRLSERLSSPYNLFPALPIALTALSVAALAGRANPVGKVVLWVWLGISAGSGWFAHQHHIIDLIAGLGLGLAAYRLLYRRRFHNS